MPIHHQMSLIHLQTQNLSFLKLQTDFLDGHLEDSKDYYSDCENYYCQGNERGNIIAHYLVFALSQRVPTLPYIRFHYNLFYLPANLLFILNSKKK
jgi:hypothetical protein